LDYPFYRLNAPIMGAPSLHRSKEMQTPAHLPGLKNGQAALASECPDQPLIITRRRHKISTTCRGWEKMIRCQPYFPRSGGPGPRLPPADRDRSVSHAGTWDRVTFVTAQGSISSITESSVHDKQLLLAVVAFCGVLFALAQTAKADDLELVSELGELRKAQGLISGYSASGESHYLDLTTTPVTPLAAAEAGLVGRTTCSIGAQDLATKFKHAWTMRVFVEGQVAPAYTCEIPATPSSTPTTPWPITAVSVSRNRAGSFVFAKDFGDTGPLVVQRSLSAAS
jgi:hypothetical protein